MKRLAALATLIVVAVLAFALAGLGGGGGGYRVDAIFDNASFLIAGQDVRIAGANAGSVVGVKVTPGNKARVEMQVDPKFGPFRSDADCFIAPQSLIGERFVQCTPGTIRGRVLQAQGGQAPTVPLADTHSPVDPDLVIDTYRLPTTERLSLIINELGAGLSGNGEALNAAIRRANPAIQATQDVLRTVDRDRQVLGDLIDRSDTVIGQLAQRRDRVASFIQEAADVSQTAAERRGAVAEGIRRLPASLTESRAALDALRRLANRSTPLLADLDVASGPLARLLGDVPALSTAARPALTHLGSMARVGTAALHDGAPVVRRLERFSELAVPAGRLTAALNLSLQANGAVEGIQTFVKDIAVSLARFDASSHILPSYVVAPPDCAVFATATSPACDGHFVSGSLTTTRAARHHTRTKHRAHRRVPLPAIGTAPVRPPSVPQLVKPLIPKLPQLPQLPGAPTVSPTTDRLLKFLLG